MENEKKKGLCGICPDKCWIEATIENGKLVKVEPDKDSPFGRVCPRGALSKEIIYSKDRILHPMVRIGKKGEGKFRRATWEEALEKAAEGFLNIKKTIRSPGTRIICRNQRKRRRDHACNSRKRCIFSTSGFSK